MSFALNGTHIEGGNFNNVAGNMTQVFNSTVRPIGPQADPGPSGLNNLNRRNRCLHPTSLADSTNPMSPTIEYDGVDEVAARFIPPHLDGGESRAHLTDISTAYNSVGGNMTQLNVTSYGESGIDILYRSVVMEALHNSGERFPEPACHPGTRIRVLEELRAWSVDTSPESSIMWLYGAAGMGKSAIAQMFAGDCQTQGRLGASFFSDVDIRSAECGMVYSQRWRTSWRPRFLNYSSRFNRLLRVINWSSAAP
ncbi:hypothetical protein B0H14DRAFT_2536015 [Mycena olivaceomarginata]|nr:hypothetical protein B0H14DRAFT_2536015 [Mycena olivaceomarginata]